jgi:hypothetical protein
LGDELVNEEVHECCKLSEINAVPEVLNVLAKAVLSELNKLKKEKEYLSHEATDVA